MNVFRVLAHNDSLYPLQPSARALALDDVHRIATGKRVRIAVVDTGVEIDHPDLIGTSCGDTQSRRWPRRRRRVPRDGGGRHHRRARGRRRRNRRSCPRRDPLALRACWPPERERCGAVCSTFTLAKALQFALDERVDIINLSVGGPRDRLLERLLDVASSRGVIVVAAVDPSAGKASFPASHRGVLAVAEVDGQDASFASCSHRVATYRLRFRANSGASFPGLRSRRRM